MTAQEQIQGLETLIANKASELGLLQYEIDNHSKLLAQLKQQHPAKPPTGYVVRRIKKVNEFTDWIFGQRLWDYSCYGFYDDHGQDTCCQHYGRYVLVPKLVKTITLRKDKDWKSDKSERYGYYGISHDREEYPEERWIDTVGVWLHTHNGRAYFELNDGTQYPFSGYSYPTFHEAATSTPLPL